MASTIEIANRESELGTGGAGAAVESSSLPNGWHKSRVLLAIVFAAATIVYACVWMYYIRKAPQSTMGFDYAPHFSQQYVEVTKARPGGPAARAGIQPGDKILSVAGQGLHTMGPLVAAIVDGRAGDTVTLQVQRPGAPAPTEARVVLDQAPPAVHPQTRAHVLIHLVLNAFPVLFVVVGVAVLFLRVDDRNAWLLAIFFAGLIATAPLLQILGLMSLNVRRFELAYSIAFFPLVPATCYYLFATFPVRSPLDVAVPWMKNVLLFLAAAFSLPIAVSVLITGNLDHIWPLIDGMPRPITGWLVNTYYFGGCGLGLVALVWNSLRAPTAGARHKIQVMVWGTVLGLSPWMLLQVVALARGDDAFDLPFWAWATAVLSLFLVPLSFAYAVVKHRVLEIPVLLRRSARYLLVQRGFLILIFILGIFATLALAQSFSQHFPSSSRQAIPVGVAFGMVLIGGGTWIQQRVSERVDKAFFRSAYNSKQILEDLVEKTREVRTRTQLSELLESNLRQAMQPTFLVVGLALGPGATEEEDALGVPLDDTFLDELFEHGRPVEITPEMRSAGLDRLGAECMVPVCGRERKKLGLLVLGPRKSEEPYSREDKHLLGLIANQAGSTLENIQLGEEIAEKIEAERRAAHEIDLARQVQRKLFPQNPPLVAGLDYAGDCVQARVVGGDYYDFFELDSGLIAFALADISGKGFPAALLMANLQANLRGQYALAADDLPRLLQSVNRLFYQNTEPSHYATMFFGCYDAQLCRLRYVNCGHNPPLLLRANDCVEKFASTATVMGLFPEWDCEVGEAQLHSGDLFVIYTDGVSEAAEPGGEEFGEARLIETLRLHRSLPASALLDRLFSTVQQFSPGEQADDMTAVVAKVK